MDIAEEELPALKKKRRPLWEYFVLFPILLFTFYSTAFILHNQIDGYRKIVLRQQLFQMRNALFTYYVLFKEFPADLSMLAGGAADYPKDEAFLHLFENLDVDAKGRVLDPLGYPYEYRNKSGRVRSSAPCCHSW